MRLGYSRVQIIEVRILEGSDNEWQQSEQRTKKTRSARLSLYFMRDVIMEA